MKGSVQGDRGEKREERRRKKENKDKQREVLCYGRGTSVSIVYGKYLQTVILFFFLSPCYSYSCLFVARVNARITMLCSSTFFLNFLTSYYKMTPHGHHHQKEMALLVPRLEIPLRLTSASTTRRKGELRSVRTCPPLTLDHSSVFGFPRGARPSSTLLLAFVTFVTTVSSSPQQSGYFPHTVIFSPLNTVLIFPVQLSYMYVSSLH